MQLFLCRMEIRCDANLLTDFKIIQQTDHTGDNIQVVINDEYVDFFFQDRWNGSYK